MRAIQYDNVSRVNWFAQKQPNELDFKAVCEDEPTIVTNSDHVHVRLCMNDAQHGVWLNSFLG